MTVLKLGFAMGGGVSLGTFCAGALAQSIKLAILYGRDKNKNLYTSVEIDVFSGASAGSISLAIMLRSLVAQNDEQKQQAIIDLKRQYPQQELDELQTKYEKKWHALVATQVMENVQRHIWVEKVKMDELLKTNANTRPPSPDYLRFTPSILNRAFLEEVAAEQIKTLPQLTENTEQPLLASRVVFASSLSNVTAINHDARGEFNVKSGGYDALSDGMTSQAHRESRVFDFHFTKTRNADEYKSNDSLYPDRWMRYHLADGKEDVIGQLHQNDDVWHRVFATSIACGAFPAAFEPVLLERYDYEFGPSWPKELKADNKRSYNFTYFDGGTFNNEPIRDAFRLASFIDANHETDSYFERAIFFVDPAVEEVRTQFNVDVHRQYSLSNPLFGDNAIGDIDGVDLVKKTSLDKLLPQVRDVLLSLFRQSRNIESDKIYKVRHKFKERALAREAFSNACPEDVTVASLRSIIAHLEAIYDKADTNALFPRASLSINSEVRRVVREETIVFAEFDVQLISSDVQTIHEGQMPTNSTSLWFKALQFLVIDEAMDLGGKIEHINFFSIAPFTFTGNKAKKVELAGAMFQAFGGFMSEDARKTDMDCGGWCARQALVKGGLLTKKDNKLIQPSTIPKLTDPKKYKAEVEKGIKDLTSRLVDMVDESNIPILSSIPKLLLKLIIKQYLYYDNAPRCSESLPKEVELWIKVPDKKYELDGRGRIPLVGDKDIKPIELNGAYYLITTASTDGKCKLIGEHIQNDTIPIDRYNRQQGKVTLPKKEHLHQVKKAPYAYLMFEIDPNALQNEIYEGQWQVCEPIVPLHERIKSCY